MTPEKNTSKRYLKKTKIVATLGPASATEEVIEALYKSGVNVFRVNFSHGTHESHKKTIDIIRTVEARADYPIAILADLQGPKLRVGRFENDMVEIKNGQQFIFDLQKDKLGDATRVYFPHPEVIEALQVGEMILLDDGKVRMEVLSKTKDSVTCKVIAGRMLKNNKGFNLPNTKLNISALTEKDMIDLDFALKHGADWIALSFVQKADDIAQAKKKIQGRAGLIAKIEKPSAIIDIDAIIEAADGIMVARGDLGVEMPPEEVPSIQKRLIAKCRAAGKPVIVATQMLESMIDNPSPTRAEASDVATAVYEGSDAVMLSAETASGSYPIESVLMMSRIAQNVERDPSYRALRKNEQSDTDSSASDAITQAAKTVADTISAALIVTYTTSGSTTLRTARTRSEIPVLALTPSVDVARRLMLSYGVYSFVDDTVTNFNEIIESTTQKVKEKGLAESGQRVVITAGVPFGTPGSTNALRIAWVK